MINLSRPKPNQPGRRPFRWNVVPLLLCVTLILAACGADSAGDVEENRQFANDPVPTREDTPAPTDEATDVPVGQSESPRLATPSTLLRTRGAPSTLYTVSNGDLVVLTVAGSQISEHVIDLPNGFEVIGLDASPTGDRVGALMTNSSGTPVVHFFAADGSIIGGPFVPAQPVTQAASPVASPGTTPVASPVATPQSTPAVQSATPVGAGSPHLVASIAWIPQGNGALVTYNDTLVTVDIEAGPQVIETSSLEGAVLWGAVSPMGNQVLVQVARPDGTEGAYLVDPSNGKVQELRALQTTPGMGLRHLAWLPHGNGVVFVEGEIVDDVIMRGQLFVYHFGNEVPRLIATSGQGGPSGTITRVAVTPDGHSVAYDVSIRDLDTWSVHSVWIRSLREDTPGIQVPVNSGQPMTGLEWSGEGLVWGQHSDLAGESRSLRLMNPEGEVVELEPGEPVDATPIASPVISTPPAVGP